jgi:hypothetical protein
VHVNIKKLGNIPEGGAVTRSWADNQGARTARTPATATCTPPSTTTPAWPYSEIHTDEKKETATPERNRGRRTGSHSRTPPPQLSAHPPTSGLSGHAPKPSRPGTGRLPGRKNTRPTPTPATTSTHHAKHRQ